MTHRNTLEDGDFTFHVNLNTGLFFLFWVGLKWFRPPIARVLYNQKIWLHPIKSPYRAGAHPIVVSRLKGQDLRNQFWVLEDPIAFDNGFELLQVGNRSGGDLSAFNGNERASVRRRSGHSTLFTNYV